MDRYWIDTDTGYANCIQLNAEGGMVAFMSDTGEQYTVKEKDVSALARITDDQLMGIDNVCNLEEVSQPAVLNTVKVRYMRKEIYTRVARILIAVNPFQTMNIYSGAYVERYAKAADSMDLDPHVYGVGLDAVNGLRRNKNTNQAILISGESGAGKTETTKLMLTYVSSAISGVEGMEDKIQQTSPILEAFGNAMTVRNNNSSRFGKWLELAVSPAFKILGASISDFLLELTRVTSQGEGERTYHVFLQILRSKNEVELSNLGLREPEEYSYLKGSCLKAPGIDDKECFVEMREAFNTLGFSPEAQLEIYQIVMGILTMGNCEFVDKDEACEVVNADEPARAAKLLGATAADLTPLITQKRIVVGKEVTVQPLKAAAARASRDGLARLIYGRLFKYLIKKINAQLKGEGESKQFFGVLDIAGFESFAVNSLEQLFINLGNEHLQDHFNSYVFKKELEDYKAEGIDVGAVIEYSDNQDILQLIDTKGGVLPMLDDEITVPRATDQTFVNKVTKAHEKHPKFVKDKFGKCMFSITHFAGLVAYTCDNFLEKNIDNPPKEAADFLMGCSFNLLKQLGGEMAEEVAAAAAKGGKSKKSVAISFRASLAQLMEKLRCAEPNFIRCVKPNMEKKPDIFTAKLVKEQLVLSGVMEAVKIRQQGYASRIPFADFLFRYKCVFTKEFQRTKVGKSAPGDDRSKCQLAIAELPTALAVCGTIDASKSFLLGTSKVLGKTQAMSVLDQAYDLSVCQYAVDIQRVYKGFKVRTMMKETKVVVAALKAWLARTGLYVSPGSDHVAIVKLKTAAAIVEESAKLEEFLAKGENLPVGLPGADNLKKMQKKMDNEVKLFKEFDSIKSTLEPIKIDKVVARAKDLEWPEDMVGPLVERRQRLKEQVPVQRAMQAALESEEMKSLQEAWDEAVNQELVGPSAKPGKWVKELDGDDLSKQVNTLLEDLKSKQTAAEAEAARIEEERLKAEEEKLAKEAAEAGSRQESRKKTITGLSMEDQQRVLLGITAAMHEFDGELLETRLGEAMSQGMEPEDLEAGQALLAGLNSEAFLADAISASQEKIMVEVPEAHDLKCVQNLLKQAKRLGVCEDEVQLAQQAMQQGIRKRASTRVKGDDFDPEDNEDMELARGAFDDLFGFPKLKPVANWKGHVSASMFSRGARGAEAMLYHNKCELKEGLTVIPANKENDAIKNYRNMLGWMHDKPVPEVQRLGFSQDIVDFAMVAPELGDEAYVQLMKQLTRNPSKRSYIHGWKLMHLLAQSACPTPDCIEFVRSFIIRSVKTNAEDHFDEVVEIAKAALVDLNQLAQPVDEVEEGKITIQVLLVDNSTRKLIVKGSQTLEKIGEVMGSTMKVFKYKDFSFFQLTDGLETHRLLPEHTVLQKLVDKWAQLKGVTGRTSRLMWKRRFLRVDEKLQVGDIMHATLSYRQAMYDYHRYPIAEEQEFLCKIGGTILCIERDQYQPYIKAKNLTEQGVMEHMLPDYVLKQKAPTRAQWSTAVLNKFTQLEFKIDAEATRLQKMSYVMSLVQKMKLFGSYYWLGKQIFQCVPEKMSIPDAPEENCKINTKQSDDEYWIVVDVFGVRFVSPSVTGKQFQRGFLFHDEAMERVVRWGAKQNVVEFVVQSINPARPKAGRVPMTIRLASTGAVDIAYAIHTIQNERKAAKRH